MFPLLESKQKKMSFPLMESFISVFLAADEDIILFLVVFGFCDQSLGSTSKPELFFLSWAMLQEAQAQVLVLRVGLQQLLL